MVVNPYKQDESRQYCGVKADGEMSSACQAGLFYAVELLELWILTSDHSQVRKVQQRA